MKAGPVSALRLEERAAALRAAGMPFAIVTVVRSRGATSAKAGARALLAADGAILEGWVGGGCARGAVAKAARQAIAEGVPRLVALRPAAALAAEGRAPGDVEDGMIWARNGCASGGALDLFVDPVVPLPELAVIGDGPVARAVLSLARGFDYRLIAVGEAMADAAVEAAELPPPGESPRYVVIATQGRGDAAALRAALAARPVLCAFVGSARKFAVLAGRLAAEGADREALGRVRAPAGLAIRAETPEEIALSILAQITAHRRGAEGMEG